jgi:succinyl-CoA synthetase beta subunit
VKIAAHPTPVAALPGASGLGIGLNDGKQARQFAQIAAALYRAYMETDASLAEINPLVVLPAARPGA